MRKTGLRTRVTIGFAAVALALSTAMAVVSYQLTRTSLLNERERTAVRATYFDATVVDGGLAAPRPNIIEILRSLDTGSTRRAVLRRDSLACQDRGHRYHLRHSLRLRQVVERGQPTAQRVRADGRPALVTGVPLSDSTSFYEIHSLDELDHTLRLLALVLTAVAVMTAAGGATLGWYAAGYATRPLRSVADAAQRIAAGDFSTRLDPAPDPDLTRLTTSFNHMVSQLSQRLDRDRRFAADLSHELRSPLQTLAAAASVLAARQPHLDQRTATAAGLVSDEIARFQVLMNDLLELARGDQPADRGPVEAAGLARQVCRRHHLPEHLVRDEPDAEPTWHVDPRRLRQILHNLIDNATKYGGGATAIRLGSTADGHYLEVDDEGPGVSAGDKAVIFDRFVRGRSAHVRRDVGGTGLGLAIVAQHATAHGGRVTVVDRPGGGSRFRVELPDAAA
jgi:signal transduction histidine kinase